MASIQMWDFAVLDAIQRTRTAWGDTLLPWVSMLANDGLLWIVIAVLPYVFKTYSEKAGGYRYQWLLPGLKMTFAMAAEFIAVNLILKNVIRRPRPCDIAPIADMLINRPPSWSMPSGHTAVSFAAATALFSINRKWGIAAYFLAALIGYTRLYLYVHFPTDVLCGALCGVVVGWVGVKLATAFVDKAKAYFFKRKL